MTLYLLALLLAIYSFVLVDPNLTFLNNELWQQLREILVNFGYYQRNISSVVFVTLVALFFWLHFWMIKNYKKINLRHLIITLSLLTVFSYPFLSHDFFNYLFDAKILTFYHQNPYLHKALDFPHDPWLRFMHWTHRTYPYGPVWLLLTLVPSFLSFGKFILAFLFFKSLYLFFFTLSVILLNKLNKKCAIIYATHPLIIFEGLVNVHNDFIALALAIIGIYYLEKKKQVLSRIFFLFSGGIKYLSLPLLFLTRDKKSKFNASVFTLILIVLGYLSFKFEIQPWYFLVLFAFLPFYEPLITKFNIFFAGLLFSYYPYVRFGGWDTQFNIQLKHNIILSFFIINILYILFLYLKKSKK